MVEKKGAGHGPDDGHGSVEDRFEGGLGLGLFEVGETVEAAEGDEVERFGLLEPL